MRSGREYLAVFLAGAVCYSVLEILFRGFTHWTMTITGGICFLLFHIMNIRLAKRSLWVRCGVGCVIITAVEFAVGYLVNIRLRLNVWDYSAHPFNLLGQVCPLFCLFWFLLGIPMVWASNAIAEWFDRRPQGRAVNP